MAIIPLKQRALIYKPDTINDWGEVIPQDPIELKCRAVEQTEVVKNQLGEEVVSGVKLMFDKLPDIRYDDVINYTNELGVAVERNPIKIEPIRMVNGKAVLTNVHM